MAKTKTRRPSPRIPPDLSALEDRLDDTLQVHDPVQFRIDKLIAQYPDAQIVAKIYESKTTGEEYFLYNIINPTPEKMSEDAIRNNNRGKGGKFIVRILVDNEQVNENTLLIGDAPGMVVPDPSTGNPFPHPDPMRMMLEEIAQLKAQIARAQAQPPSSIVELVQALSALKQLEPPKPETNIDSMIKLIELGKSLGGGAPVDDDWMGVIKGIVKEAAPALVPAIMAGAISRPTQPGNNGSQQANGVPAVQHSEENPMIEEAMLRKGIEFLKKKALNSASNPELYVGLIVDNENESPYDRLIYRINTEDFPFFARIDPEIGNEPYATFFRAIFDGVRSCYRESDSLDNNSSGSTGNAGNVASDGGPHKGRGA